MKSIKRDSIKPANITEIKSFKRPTVIAANICRGLAYILTSQEKCITNQNYDCFKKLCRDMKLVEKMKDYDIKNTD